MKRRLDIQKEVNQIVITGNCQTHGIAQAIQSMAQGYSVSPIWKLSPREDVIRDLIAISKPFIWVTSYHDEEITYFTRENKVNISKIIKIPDLWFDAFHPDLTYIQNYDGAVINSILGPYHSRIAFWAYVNSVSLGDTLKMFNIDLYRSVGYLEMWGQSIDKLKNLVKESDLPQKTLDQLFSQKKKFMHTANHTNQLPLSIIAAEVLALLGIPQRFTALEHSLVAKDIQFWHGPIFAYYPEIAACYGESGSYIFRNQEGNYYSLQEFVEGAWSTYAKLDLDKINLDSAIPKEFDRVLERWIK